MGNININRMTSTLLSKDSPPKQYESVQTFKFLDFLPEEDNNGLYLNGVYFPEEVIMMILSYVNPQEILKVSEVCKKWFNLTRSDSFWATIYSRKYNKKAKKLPWYVYYCLLSTNYFNKNLIKNGNGQEQFKHWKIILNYGDEFKIEDPPAGSDPLPVDVPEFNGKTSCFATSYYECNKLQEINIENNRLMQLILDRYKPHIYVSEWVAARFDCACVYTLWCKLYGFKVEKENQPRERRHLTPDCELLLDGEHQSDEQQHDEDQEEDYEDLEEPLHVENVAFHEEQEHDEDHEQDYENLEEPLHVQSVAFHEEQWMGKKWSKLEFIVKDYPMGVQRIVFQHEGKDTQFWKGHYGSKMAGGVLKILFDTIEPVM